MTFDIATTLPAAKDTVLFMLAVYGAGLSTFNLIQATRRERRKLTVVLSTALPHYPGQKFGKPIAVVEVVNVGLRPVTVKHISIELEGGARLADMQPGDIVPGMRSTVLPATLADGASALFYMAYEDIGHALQNSGRADKVTLTPVAEDSSGTTHKGKPWITTAADLIHQARAR